MEPPDLRKLVVLLVDGNPEAFRLLIRTYSPSIRSFIAARVFRMDEVDDLAQEVFLAAFHGRSDLSSVNDIGAWLRGIAANKVLMYARSAARRADMLERFRFEVVRRVDGELERLAAEERADVLDRLLHCIEKLPDKMRRIVRGGLDGSKATLLAQELGVAVGTIYNLNSQANGLLRDCLRGSLNE